MGIFIIGSGRVASYFAESLFKKGKKLIGIFSRNAQTGELLANKVKTNFFKKIPELQSEDTLLICINDDSLKSLNIPKTEATILHSSGAVPMDVLSKFSEKVGVFYPLQTFAGVAIKIPEKFPILIEGNTPKTTEVAIQLSNLLELEYKFINSVQRKEVHINAVILNNFLTYLLRKVHQRNIVEQIDSNIYKPLLAQTILNSFLTYEGFNPQTGPAIRKDSTTITSHLNILKQEDLDLFEVYEFFTEKIQQTLNEIN